MPKTPADGKANRRRILEFIWDHTENVGYPPSYREIMAECDLVSTSGVAYHLKVLEEQGLITRVGRLARTVQLVGYHP